MEELLKFFNKSVGVWESHRTYMYPNSNRIKSVVTNFEWINPSERVYEVNWASLEGEGNMVLNIISDSIIERNVGYFTAKPTISKVLTSNENCLVTETVYNNTIFVETIDFITTKHRTRRTIAYKEYLDCSKGPIILSGSYQEKKV